jgi:hypothetical protein
MNFAPVRVEHAIVTGLCGLARSRSFRTPAMLLRNAEGRIMDHAQIASQYRNPRRHAY